MLRRNIENIFLSGEDITDDDKEYLQELRERSKDLKAEYVKVIGGGNDIPLYFGKNLRIRMNLRISI